MEEYNASVAQQRDVPSQNATSTSSGHTSVFLTIAARSEAGLGLGRTLAEAAIDVAVCAAWVADGCVLVVSPGEAAVPNAGAGMGVPLASGVLWSDSALVSGA